MDHGSIEIYRDGSLTVVCVEQNGQTASLTFNAGNCLKIGQALIDSASDPNFHKSYARRKHHADVEEETEAAEVPLRALRQDR